MQRNWGDFVEETEWKWSVFPAPARPLHQPRGCCEKSYLGTTGTTCNPITLYRGSVLTPPLPPPSELWLSALASINYLGEIPWRKRWVIFFYFLLHSVLYFSCKNIDENACKAGYELRIPNLGPRQRTYQRACLPLLSHGSKSGMSALQKELPT